MPSFSQRSRDRLHTCHPDLIKVMETAIIDGPDFTVICGHRSVQEQQRLYAQGRTAPGNIVTNIDGINRLSKHNMNPAMAVDIAPWPVDWSNTDRFLILGGYILGVARGLDIPLKWGGDWNQNYNNRDERFSDLPHFQLET